MFYLFLCPYEFSQFLNRYNKYIFEKTIPTIFVCDLLHVGTGTNFRHVAREGKWQLHLRPDTNSSVLPELLVFEDG
jgi:hypothetical protein